MGILYRYIVIIIVYYILSNILDVFVKSDVKRVFDLSGDIILFI